MVHVITGPGKGKTTAAFGLAMRAAGHGIRVCVVQFMKSGETTGEVLAAQRMEGVEVHQFGTGRFVRNDGISEEDRACARKALEHAEAMLVSGMCGMLVLDEVNVAASLGLVSAREVVSMLLKRPEDVEVVLTGRDAPQEFVECADYVSRIETVKHPFEKGTRARKGVEW